MENLPTYLGIIFIATTLLTVLLFFKASNYSTATLFILSIWLILQVIISSSGFYTVTDTMPPRLFLAVIPPLLLILILFATSKGRRYIDSLDLKTLTILHVIRIPVEIVLFLLCIYKVVPQLMTFEGMNFDIIAGITAPIIYYFGFVKQMLSRKAILIWNIICVGLLMNIIFIAALSAPFPFQQLAFDQPNIAVLNFPFQWLPSCVVPLVLLSHLASIRQLIQTRSN